MNNNENRCNHCGARVSEPKPINTGPRKGQTQTVCTKCGHSNCLPANPQTVTETIEGQGIRNFKFPQAVHT